MLLLLLSPDAPVVSFDLCGEVVFVTEGDEEVCEGGGVTDWD